VIYYVLKLLISAAIIVAVSEIAKRSAGLGAILLALPLLSIIAMTWLYIDTQDAERVAALSFGTFWLVLPTLPMFLVIPAMLRAGWSFSLSLGGGVLVTLVCYGAMALVLPRIGVKL
jgi:hypothetical protein